jgi:hypothetical protein
MKARVAKNRWKGIFFRLLLGVFLVWLLLFDSNNLRKMTQIHRQAAEMKAKYERQAAINDSLRVLNREKEVSPAEWEREARDKGMQKTGESVIRVIKH